MASATGSRIIVRNEALMQTQLPETVTQTFYIMAYSIGGGEYSITVSSVDLSVPPTNYILLGTEEITFKIPQVDFNKARIEALNNEKSAILANSQIAVNKIDEKIQLLTCIEHKK